MCVSHDMPLLARVADRVVAMAGGRIVADGSARTVFGDEAALAGAGLIAPQVTRLGRALSGGGRSRRRVRSTSSSPACASTRPRRSGARPGTPVSAALAADRRLDARTLRGCIARARSRSWRGSLATVLVVLVTVPPAVLVAISLRAVLLAASSGTGRATATTVIALAPVAASIVVIQSLAPAACGGGLHAGRRARAAHDLPGGAVPGLVLVTRLLAMEVVAVPLLATTHPSDLFAALRRLRLPYEIALMASLSLRLVPQLRRELDEVLGRAARPRVPCTWARRARARARSGGGRHLRPPDDDGARARGTRPRRRADPHLVPARRPRPGGRGSSLAALVAAVAGVALAATSGSTPTPVLDVPPTVAVLIVGLAALVFVVVLARGARALGGR